MQEKKKNVEKINVPMYDELSVKELFPELRKDDQFMLYMPDKLPAKKLPAREYFMDVLNTLYPDYLEQIIQHACQQRHTVQDDDQRLDAIKKKMQATREKAGK